MAATVIADTPAAPAMDFNFDTSNNAIRVLVRHNGEVIEGKASSDALCLASPVWKKFLFPPWEVDEELRHSVKQIDCTEDDSEALLILLNIAHLRFNKVSNELKHQKLFNIAKICDQYDCITLVQPWLETGQWLREAVLGMHLFNNDEQYGWLFIAWVFGLERLFHFIALCLVKRIRMDTSSIWRTFSPLPPGIIENILALRKTYIESLLKVPYDVLDQYESAWQLQSPSKVCSKTKEGESGQCDAFVYGSLVLGLRLCGLYPRKAPDDVIVSVTELRHNLLAVKIHHHSGEAHHDCGVKHYGISIDQEFMKQKEPVLESHWVLMRAQKKRRTGS